MNTIINYTYVIQFFLLIGLAAPVHAIEDDMLNEHFYLKDEVKAVSIDKNKNHKHAEILYFVEKSQDTSSGELKIIERGKGNYGQYTNILWENNSSFNLYRGLMQINKSIKRIYDEEGRLIETISKIYDYQENVVTFQRVDASGRIVFEKQFSILGPICDDTNLVHFIRGIFTNGVINEYKSFYLLTNEPKIYKVNTKFINNETLKLPGGTYEAIKLQLMADLGVLTEIAAKIVSPTFVWLAKDYPHAWLQYEGMESGRHSAKVKTYIFNKKGSES